MDKQSLTTIRQMMLVHPNLNLFQIQTKSVQLDKIQVTQAQLTQPKPIEIKPKGQLLLHLTF